MNTMIRRKRNRKKRKRMKGGVRRGVYILPNLLTSGSLVGGFYAIVAAFNGDYIIAAIAIMIAFFFDGVDGRVARLTRTTSRFGVEYDSLADLVAFGVAPGILVFSWALQPYGRVGWLAAFLYVACGALRLARFNVQADTMEHRFFRGLPIPMAACMIAASVFLLHHLGEEGETKHLSLLILIYVLAFLMVSNIRYPSFKDLELIKRKPFSALVAMILTIVVVVAEPAIMLFTFSILYILIGPTNIVRHWYLKRVGGLSKEKAEPLTR
jgi:CDP-diacylglycerol--serine O-phosphatidyltransferase